MGDRAIAWSSVIIVGIVLLAFGVLATVIISYQSMPNINSCLSLTGALSILDSQYSCYDSGNSQSALSLLFKKQVGSFQVIFTDSSGKKQVEVVSGSAADALRLLNGKFNEPISYASDGIETFVYSGGAASAVEISPIVDGQVCGTSDSRTLEPCSPDILASIKLGEDNNLTNNFSHLECRNNACTRVSGSGVDSCTVENSFCGSRGGGGGGRSPAGRGPSSCRSRSASGPRRGGA